MYQETLWLVMEIWKGLEKSGNLKISCYDSLQKTYFCSRKEDVHSSERSGKGQTVLVIGVDEACLDIFLSSIISFF